jgi:hypothetical protein
MGFSARRLRWTFSVASWTAAALIMTCSVILLRENTAATPAQEIVAATHFLAEHLSP